MDGILKFAKLLSTRFNVQFHLHHRNFDEWEVVWGSDEHSDLRAKAKTPEEAMAKTLELGPPDEKVSIPEELLP